jgi:hypothetical protein
MDGLFVVTYGLWRYNISKENDKPGIENPFIIVAVHRAKRNDFVTMINIQTGKDIYW